MKLRYRYVAYGGGSSMVDQMQHMHQLMHQMIARATPGAMRAWQPPTDVYESDDAVVVQVELAGVKDDDVDITLFADRLTVAGVRHQRVPPGTAAYYLAGILYGEFRIDVPLVADILRDQVEATLEDGLLTIVLPKAVGPQPSAISVSATAVASSAEADR